MPQLTEIPAEDIAAIRDVLLAWRAEGNPEPLLPMDIDVDGDGICDAFGLDANDDVIIVLSAPIDNTVFTSEGEA